VAQLYPWALGSLYVTSYDSQGNGWGILTRLRKIPQIQVQVILRPTASRPVCLDVGIPSGAYKQIFFLSDNSGFLAVSRLLWREDGSVIYSYNCFSALQEQSLVDPSPAELRPYLTVSFETPSTWRARSPNLYPPVTGWSSIPPGNIWTSEDRLSRTVRMFVPSDRSATCKYK
jgi:hypothetical protein